MRDWMGGLPNTDLNASVNACCRVRLFASAYSLMFIAFSFHREFDWGFRGLFPSVPTIPTQTLDLSAYSIPSHHPRIFCISWSSCTKSPFRLGRDMTISHGTTLTLRACIEDILGRFIR